MRFSLRQLLAITTLAGLAICLLPTFFTETVKVRIESVAKIKGESQPKSDYIVTFQTTADGQITCGALFCNYGYNDLLGEQVEIDNVERIEPQTVEYSYSTIELPSMKRVSFVDTVKGEFNEMIFRPTQEEIRRSFQNRF